MEAFGGLGWREQEIQVLGNGYTQIKPLITPHGLMRNGLAPVQNSAYSASGEKKNHNFENTKFQS